LLRELHFDAAVNNGVGTAKSLLHKSGGDAGAYAQLRKNLYQNIAANNPSQKQFLQGWLNRVTGILKDYNKNFKQGAHKPTGK
jgi:hypothetical protein